MVTRELTAKQQLFYKNYYIQGSETFLNGPESARRAGYKGNSNTLRQRAHELVTHSNAKAEKERLQTKTGADVGYTIDKYQSDLDEDRTLARQLRQPSAAVSATVAKGRSMGYDKDNDAGSNKDQPDTLSPEDLTTLRTMAKAINEQGLQGPRLAQDGSSVEQKKEVG